MMIGRVSSTLANRSISHSCKQTSTFTSAKHHVTGKLMAGEVSDDVTDRFFVAVHVGAGYHSPINEKALRSAMKTACIAAASILRTGCGGCVDAVSAAIETLENDPCTNAGRGSNLTEDGHVECDASVMDGNSGAFGAVGAVPANDYQV
ncbi:hypothetical protein QVD17_20566 [Tagetes erecta]|uniref:Threonine aspartase n=1 Tax=Tagetes erecta TaxID=13708 RepID=A0AAD8KLF7_TARER|nr:hypothetical protein QVD17_20566 [Tagetes erecta]